MAVNLNGFRGAISRVIRTFGQSCVLTKPDGTTANTIAYVDSGETETKTDSFISSISKTAYMVGAVGAIPEPGDTLTFNPNIYVVSKVDAMGVGEGKKNVFAYKLELGTA